MTVEAELSVEEPRRDGDGDDGSRRCFDRGLGQNGRRRVCDDQEREQDGDQHREGGCPPCPRALRPWSHGHLSHRVAGGAWICGWPVPAYTCAGGARSTPWQALPPGVPRWGSVAVFSPFHRHAVGCPSRRTGWGPRVMASSVERLMRAAGAGKVRRGGAPGGVTFARIGPGCHDERALFRNYTNFVPIRGRAAPIRALGQVRCRLGDPGWIRPLHGDIAAIFRSWGG